MSPRFYDLIVDVAAVQGRRFTYSAPDALALPRGAKVLVPFGRGEADAFVEGGAEEPPQVQLKPIKAVYDPEFMPSRDLLSLSSTVAEYYCAPLASTWSVLWPPIVPRRKPEQVVFCPGGIGGGTAEGSGRTPGDAVAALVRGSAGFRWRHYIERASAARSNGRGVVVLVPEIKGVQEALRRLEAAFPGEVAQLHSELTGVTRREGYLSLVRGQRAVALGTRSAVFAPVRDAGLIIVDEESSESYKSPDTPFYDSRTVAIQRGRQQGCEVLLGSSHPTIDSMWKAMHGALALLEERADSPCRAAAPSRVLVNLRETRRGPDVMSQALVERLRDVFASGSRAVLFLNRRGDSAQVTCRDCGSTVVCPRCGVPLAYHAKGSSLVCHTCGFTREAPDVCPACGGHNWRFGGFGIERAESEFKRLFPGVAIFRLDKDVSREVPASAVLAAFAAARPSCLLATRMAVGFPVIPGVALVGVLSCDTLLNLPDYRASEKVFHLLSSLEEMVDGSLPGAALIAQTHNPDHPGVRGILDPDAFYRAELDNRRVFGYPPFKSFFVAHFSGKSPGRVRDAAQRFAALAAERGEGVEVLGPSPSMRAKVRGEYRWQVALRGPDHAVLAALCRDTLAAVGQSGAVKVSVDADPVDMA